MANILRNNLFPTQNIAQDNVFEEDLPTYYQISRKLIEISKVSKNKLL